jgi:hypothetical protein
VKRGSIPFWVALSRKPWTIVMSIDGGVILRASPMTTTSSSWHVSSFAFELVP